MARPKFSETDTLTATAPLPSNPPADNKLLSELAEAPVITSEAVVPSPAPVASNNTPVAVPPSPQVNVEAPAPTSANPVSTTASMTTTNVQSVAALPEAESVPTATVPAPPVAPATSVPESDSIPEEPSIDLAVTEKPKAQAAPVISNVYKITDAKNIATECKFDMESSKFVHFLKTISLGKTIKDAYIYVREDNKLFCAAAEPSSNYVIAFNEIDGVTTTRAGRLLVSDITKLSKVVETLKGEATFSYKDGKLTLKGKGTRAKKAELLGLQESYIHSLKGLINKEVNLNQHKIGKLDFSQFTHFFIDMDVFKEMIEAADAINLPSFRFNIDKTTPDNIDIVITNQQDSYTISITPENFSYGNINVRDKKTNALMPADSYSVCFSPAIREITSLLSGKAEIYMSADCMIIMQAGCCYLVVPCKL